MVYNTLDTKCASAFQIKSTIQPLGCNGTNVTEKGNGQGPQCFCSVLFAATHYKIQQHRNEAVLQKKRTKLVPRQQVRKFWRWYSLEWSLWLLVGKNRLIGRSFGKKTNFWGWWLMRTLLRPCSFRGGILGLQSFPLFFTPSYSSQSSKINATYLQVPSHLSYSLPFPLTHSHTLKPCIM